MLPMRPLRLALGSLLAADTAYLAPASTPNKIALINAPFTPNETMTASSLSFATFTGSTPIAGTAGAQGVGNNPLIGSQQITILAPAGGWRWTCTAAPGSPDIIYGFALLDTTLATLLGVQLLPQAISIQSVGDEVDLGAILITFVTEPMS